MRRVVPVVVTMLDLLLACKHLEIIYFQNFLVRSFIFYVTLWIYRFQYISNTTRVKNSFHSLFHCRPFLLLYDVVYFPLESLIDDD